MEDFVEPPSHLLFRRPPPYILLHILFFSRTPLHIFNFFPFRPPQDFKWNSPYEVQCRVFSNSVGHFIVFDQS